MKIETNPENHPVLHSVTRPLDDRYIECRRNNLASRQTSSRCLSEAIAFTSSLTEPFDSTQVYLVPSMLEAEAHSEILKVISSTEVPALVVRFHNQYLPFGVFPRLVVRCAVWCLKNFSARRQPKLYKNYARFFLEGGHQVVVASKLNSVFVNVVGGKSAAMTETDHKRWGPARMTTADSFSD